MGWNRGSPCSLSREGSHLLHVIPVGDDAVLDGVLECEDTPLALRLVAHVAVFLPHAYHDALTPAGETASLASFKQPEEGAEQGDTRVPTWCRGRPTMEGKTARGASSPAKPALQSPEPLSQTRAVVSSSHMVGPGEAGAQGVLGEKLGWGGGGIRALNTAMGIAVLCPAARLGSAWFEGVSSFAAGDAQLCKNPLRAAMLKVGQCSAPALLLHLVPADAQSLFQSCQLVAGSSAWHPEPIPPVGQAMPSAQQQPIPSQ